MNRSDSSLFPAQLKQACEEYKNILTRMFDLFPSFKPLFHPVSSVPFTRSFLHSSLPHFLCPEKVQQSKGKEGAASGGEGSHGCRLCQGGRSQ